MISMAESDTDDQDPYSDDTPSPASVDSPSSSNGIVMLSLSDSQDDAIPQDVFHTPPENSSLPSSDHNPSDTPAAVHHCVVNDAVHIDADTGLQGFVDLGTDSELGFSEVQLTQEMDVNQCSHGDPRYVCQFNGFGDFERELSDLGESPVKKSKLSEHHLGFDSSEDCMGVQSQKMEEGIGNGEGNLVSEENEIPLNKNCCVKNVETLAGDFTVEGIKSSDRVVEASGMQKKSDEEPRRRVLPPSIRGCLGNAASEMKCGDGSEKKNVFDVLRVLSENSDDVEENVDKLCLLEVARARGITFPRPRWWPNNGDNFDS